MNKSTFFIVGKHAVIGALKNPHRKVIRVFLTEESKKTIHKENKKVNLLKSLKVHFKTKKELDNYTSQEQLLHQGYIAEIEKLENLSLREFIRNKNNLMHLTLNTKGFPKSPPAIILYQYI